MRAMDNERRSTTVKLRQVSVIVRTQDDCVFVLEASVPRGTQAARLRDTLSALVVVVQEAVETGAELDIDLFGDWLSVRVTDSN